MTQTPFAGSADPGRPAPRVKISSPASTLAVIPLLLGFHPERSIVVLGIAGPRSGVKMTFRYDLPDPPGPDGAGEIVAHARTVLARERAEVAIVVGYGPGRLVTPVADAITPAIRAAGIKVQDVIRAEDGRYWSYLCRDPRCCPPEGVAFDAGQHPIARSLAASGLSAHRDRASLAATLDQGQGQGQGPDPEAAAATGAAMEVFWAEATRRIRAAIRAGRPGELNQEVEVAGRQAVREALALYRKGGSLTDPAEVARLGALLAHIAVRDDAWARMDPAHHEAHRRLWTDLVRRLPEGFVAPAAALLAFVCWQEGDGAMASIAVERALRDDPGYSMAELIGEAVLAGLPPSAALIPMTPEEVEASYAAQRRGARGRARPDRPALPPRPASPGRRRAG